MSNVFYSPSAEKQIRILPKTEQRKILRKIELLATNPLAGKPLMGELKSYFSLRAWPYRVIYTFSKTNGITIHSVAHRQNAYK
jgi:mRNA-degrading endonuclease RelE of RelBE toxin-antitoxin system